MYCQNCGTKNEGTICTNCGKSLQDNEKEKKKPIYKKWWFWLIAVIVILIIAISIGSSGNSDSDSTGSSPGSVGQVSVDSNNIVENCVEYSINRVFVTSILEAFIDGGIYYSPEEGKEYVVVDMNVKNLKSDFIMLENMMSVNIEVNSITYNATGFVVTEDSIDEYSGLDPLAQGRAYYAVQVPKDTPKDNIKLTVECNGKIASCSVSILEYEQKKEYMPIGKEYTDNATISATLEKVYFSKKVSAPKEYGGYEADNGKTYLVAKFNVRNLKGNSLDIEDVAGVKCIYQDKYNYNGFECAESVDGDDLDPYDYIEPLETRKVYYLIEVPEDLEKNTNVELEIYLLGKFYKFKVK